MTILKYSDGTTCETNELRASDHFVLDWVGFDDHQYVITAIDDDTVSVMPHPMAREIMDAMFAPGGMGLGLYRAMRVHAKWLAGRLVDIERLSQPKREPKFLRARCGVRYWEDATVDGEVDTDGSRIPCREGTAVDNDHLGGGDWCPTIELATGKIEGWPRGTVAEVHYKVCDNGTYELLDAERNIVATKDGYVPAIMCPGDDGYGDYVIMSIGHDGVIADWRADLSAFEKNSG